VPAIASALVDELLYIILWKLPLIQQTVIHIIFEKWASVNIVSWIIKKIFTRTSY